jgi:hypothetical protein
MSARFIVGDVFDVMAKMPDSSVDLVLTSPPFLALRSYLPEDHPNKSMEIGAEPTPSAFIDTLLALSAEWARVLTPHGSLCVELGDSYSGSGSGGGLDAKNPGKGKHPKATRSDDEWPLAKSLCFIPEIFGASLSYGRNLLTGNKSPSGEWRVRNVVRWVRPNPPVAALSDKFRPASSSLVVACKSKDRFFDLDAVREPHKNNVDPSKMDGNGYRYRDPSEKGNGTVSMPGNPLGAPPLDWWQITSEGYAGSHYATWPKRLLTRPILSMCPQQVCMECAQPRLSRIDNFSDCGHKAFRKGIVFDPFAGSGTTLMVAEGLGRDSIGCDLDERNADLALERCGMFLEVTR